MEVNFSTELIDLFQVNNRTTHTTTLSRNK